MSGTARKSGAGRTSRLDFATRANEAQSGRAIPLNLGPMLAVYKNRRRLSLRIEGLPHLARLSAGKNNGDNSWSLSFSEIDTLAYLPPEGAADESPTLSVRVIDLDSGGSTLAVLDLSVSPTATEQGPDSDESTREGHGSTREAQLRALREELAQAKSALKAQEADLMQLRQKSQRAETELTRARIETELGGGRARKGEVDESKFANLDAKLVLRGGDPNASDDSEGETGAGAAEGKDGFIVRKGKAQPSTVMPAEGTLSEEKAQALFGQARQRREQDVAAALAKAETAWKADEAKRLAAAEAQWQAKAAGPLAQNLAQSEERCRRAEKALAEATARNDALVTRHRENTTELERLGQECAELRKSVTERESAIAQTSVAGERTREELQRKNDQTREELTRKTERALARAAEVWRAEEAARFAAAEAQWRSQSSSAVAALTSRCERAEQALAEVNARAQFASQRNADSSAEIQSLREECTGLKSRLAEREANLARAQEDFGRAREKSDRETKDLFAKAEAAWKTDAAARLAAVESAWQQKLNGALTEATGRAERAEHALAEVTRKIEASSSRDRNIHNELDQLRQQCAALKGQLDERAVALADAHTEFDEARKSWRQEMDVTLANAEAAWKAAEATRLATAERAWENKAAGALKEAQTRSEAAEKASADTNSRSNSLRTELAKVSEHSRAQIEALRERVSENDRLRAEVSELRAVVAKQESALTNARSGSADAKASSRGVEESVAAAQAAWKADEAARLAATEEQWRRQSENATAELSVRCERAEKNAQESRAHADALAERDQSNRFELRRLREELAIAQGDLASREAELETLRAQEEEARVAEPAIVLQPDRISLSHAYEDEPPKPKGHLMRDAIVVACIGVAAVLGWPWIEAYVPQLGGVFGSVSVQAPPAPAPVAEPERPSAVVIHAGNLRAGPSGNSATSGTLQAGAKVEPLEKQGSWTKVRVTAPNAPVKEGWIFSSFLQDEKEAAPKAQPGKAK